MILRIPSYYKYFTCIADACRDSCCIGWEIDIDEETFAYYRNLEGPFGDRLRASMTSGEENSFRLKAGSRCPFLNQRGLCDIVLTLGETSLCEICTEYPRFTLEYADVREKCLGISCEEVGRILFSDPTATSFEESVIAEEYAWESEEFEEAYPEDDFDDEETVLARVLQSARDTAIRILQDRERRIEDRICRYLLFCEQVQGCLNEEDYTALERVVSEADRIPTPRGAEDSFAERKIVLDGMEILDEEWRGAIAHVEEVYRSQDPVQRGEMIRRFMDFYRSREYEYEHLMVYFTFRYAMKAVFDYRFLAKAQLAVLSFLTIRDMDAVRFADQGNAFSLADRIDNARIYSKEVEHSEDNLEYLAESFMFEEALHVDALCRQVLFGS